jgi:hypothetical protein
MSIKQPAGLFRIDENSPGIPAIFDRQRVQLTQYARRTQFRETINGDYSDVLTANPWLHTTVEIFAGKNLIQIRWNLRKGKRVILSADTPTQVP